jgi:acyl dehydratase
MVAELKYVDVAERSQLPKQQIVVSREMLITFCGAALDFAGPHWNERIAKSVGLPDVIMHGQLTVAMALRLVNDWVGDPAAIVAFRARFAKPIAVPDNDTGAALNISGLVASKRDDKQVELNLTVASTDNEVLARIQVVVQLA